MDKWYTSIIRLQPIKNGFDMPKLQHVHVTFPAYKEVSDLNKFDKASETTLYAETDVKIEGKSLKQAVFQVRMGGLGIR